MAGHLQVSWWTHLGNSSVLQRSVWFRKMVIFTILRGKCRCKFMLSASSLYVIKFWKGLVISSSKYSEMLTIKGQILFCKSIPFPTCLRLYENLFVKCILLAFGKHQRQSIASSVDHPWFYILVTDQSNLYGLWLCLSLSFHQKSRKKSNPWQTSMEMI